MVETLYERNNEISSQRGHKISSGSISGFGVDNLETLQEIDIENKEYFEDAGGENFHYIPCLNDDDDHVEFLISLIGK